MDNTTGARGRTLDDEFDFNASDLSKQFEQLLRTRRITELEEQAEQARRNRSSSPSVQQRAIQSQRQQQQPQTPTPAPAGQQTPPVYRNFRNTPLVPCAPQDAQSLRFRNMLLTYSNTPMNYENPGLLDEALTHVPIDRIYTDAEEEHNIMKAIAASNGDNARPEWGYQDCVIRALLRWFKREFFEYVTNPKCSRCHGSATVARGHATPTPDEAACGATKAVELYQCQRPGCGAYERFPRYSDVWTLLKTRRGRGGEWVNCFTMLCRAAGARVRWVWSSEDAVWTEIYSEHQRRWVHIDPCEEIWDEPRVYTEGWGRKLAYCIAFSSDGATDVTRRYVRNPSLHGLSRTRCPEEVLLWCMLDVRRTRRANMEKDARRRLMREDEREERELQRYVADSVASEMIQSLPGAIPPPPQQQQQQQQRQDMKTPTEQQQTSEQWTAQQMQNHNADPRQGGR